MSTVPVAPGDGFASEAERRRAVRAWCLYDVANSAFATSIMVAVLPEFFSRTAREVMPVHLATAWWGYASAIALLVAAALGPIVGAIGDQLGNRRALLAACVAIGAGTTALLGALPALGWGAMLALFGVAFVAFGIGIVLYDSMLPSVARRSEMHRVSARGFAWGYLGGGLLLALHLAWILAPARFGLPDATAAVRLAFVSVALWWAGFSLPLLRRVPEPHVPESPPPLGALAGAVGAGLLETLRRIRRSPDLFRFLIAFWLYSDGVGTVVKMASVYGAEVGIGRADLIGALLMVQLVAAPASLAFGRLAGRIGPQPAVIAGLIGYVGIAILGFFLSRPWHFWALGVLVALLQGGVQAISRSMFASLVPRRRLSEMFGFYSVSEKLAGVVGPLLFALATQFGGAGRLGVLTLIPFFVVGAWMLSRVDLERGAALADAAAPPR